MKYVDIKYTIWQRMKFSDNANIEEIIKQIEINGPDIIDEELGFQENEILFDTEEFISPDENQENPTIEVYDESQNKWNPIWDNLNGKV